MKNIQRRLRQALFGGLALSLGALAFWPVAADGEPGGPREAKACERSLARLTSNLRTAEQGQEVLTESQINAHLGEILGKNPQAHDSHGLTLGVRDLRVDLEPAHAQLFVTAELGGIPLVLRSRFAPEEVGGEPLRLESMRLGHLPLVWPFRELAARRLDRMLGGLRSERSLLGSLSAIELKEGEVELRVGPRS